MALRAVPTEQHDLAIPTSVFSDAEKVLRKDCGGPCLKFLEHLCSNSTFLSQSVLSLLTDEATEKVKAALKLQHEMRSSAKALSVNRQTSDTSLVSDTAC